MRSWHRDPGFRLCSSSVFFTPHPGGTTEDAYWLTLEWTAFPSVLWGPVDVCACAPRFGAGGGGGGRGCASAVFPRKGRFEGRGGLVPANPVSRWVSPEPGWPTCAVTSRRALALRRGNKLWDCCLSRRRPRLLGCRLWWGAVSRGPRLKKTLQVELALAVGNTCFQFSPSSR